jgi:phosphoribosylanthranilate isomerase
MFVKICGITRVEDAQVAVAYGASAIGFIFWPNSPRRVSRDQARAIVRALPPLVTPVGVFVNQPVDFINEVANDVGLGAVQLHGDETPELLDRIQRPVVKAMSRIEPHAAALWPSHVLLLVDAHDPARRGGTGARADWAGAARLASDRPILLAGGIDPSNVVEAAVRVRPFGIDVSSGVEASPGIKDHARIEHLFDMIRSAGPAMTTTRERTVRTYENGTAPRSG